MKTNLKTYTEAQISEAKFSELADIYNVFASQLDIKPLKKFRDKSTGIARILKIQAEYVEKRNSLAKTVTKESKPTFNMKATVSTLKNESKEGSIEWSLHKAILTGSNMVEDVVAYIVTNHKRPRSGLGVDQQYAIHNIKWFVKKGHLKLED